MSNFKSIYEVLGLDPISSLEEKKLDISNKLNNLMGFCGFRQKDLANLRKWKKSYVSKILSGDQNLTIKTILEFSEALGYEFDLVFYEKGSNAYFRQPWDQIDWSQNFIESPVPAHPWVMIIDEFQVKSVTESPLKSFIDVIPERNNQILSYLDNEVNSSLLFQTVVQPKVGDLA